MAKSTISKEVLNIIRKSVDEAVKKSVDAIIRANKEFDATQTPKNSYIKPWTG